VIVVAGAPTPLAPTRRSDRCCRQRGGGVPPGQEEERTLDRPWVCSIPVVTRLGQRIIRTPGIFVGLLLCIGSLLLQALSQNDVLAAVVMVAAIMAFGHGVVSLAGDAVRLVSRRHRDGKPARRPHQGELERSSSRERTSAFKPRPMSDRQVVHHLPAFESQRGRARKHRNLDRLASDARQGRSGDNYVERVLEDLRRDRRYIVDRGIFPEARVNGRGVGDVDWLIRDNQTGACVSLEVKTSDPRYGEDHRRQAARAAEAVRIRSEDGWRPLPVVVYVDRDRRFDKWKTKPLQKHQSEEVGSISAVYSVGARNLRKALAELLL